MAEHRININNIPRVVEIAVGDVLVIDLQENPTTGYRWQASGADQFAPSGDVFVAHRDGAVGGDGIRTLSFTATSVGKGNIELELRREWETGAPQRSVTIAYQTR